MALANYTGLKAAIQSWSTLTGSAYTGVVDDIIGLCESRIFYGDDELGCDPLRVRAMESSTDITVDGQEEALPTGFLESRRLFLNTSKKEDLPYYPPDRFWQSQAASNNSTGQPVLYTIEGENLVFAPSPDATYVAKMLSYNKLTGLSDNNPTNWIITNTPQVYLYGCLLEQAIFDKNDQDIVKHGALFKGAINAINRQDKKAKHSGSVLTQKPDVSAPHLGAPRYRH